MRLQYEHREFRNALFEEGVVGIATGYGLVDRGAEV
jgi:hypothetical protein